jgi:hypothetical protein
MVPLLPYPNLCAHSHLIAHTHARTPTPSHIPALYPARIDLRASSLNPTSSLSATTPDRTRTRFTILPYNPTITPARIAAGQPPDDFNKDPIAFPSNFAKAANFPCGKTQGPEAIQATWKAGETVDIVWTNTITHGGTVRISLLKSQGDPNPVILKDKIDYRQPDPTQPNNG